MFRTALASLALVALVRAAPITEATRTTENSVGDTTTGDYPAPTFIIFPPITGPIKPSDKRDTEVKERQFTIGDPSTWWGVGGDKPPTPTGDATIGTPITGGLNPSDKRQTLVGGTDPTKAKIVALELEYETLLHAFGNSGPKVIQNRLQAIKDELLKKYGITIVQSPDGTTTTFTPGKRQFTFPGGPLPGGPLIPEDPLPGGPLEPSN
ncbi:hypothetical protein GQX73_g9362 [Xylaria multiplex]|uniref:Uncharacterized protein n=1 Tax=Xylaria multiplex TaxID=323545 RepID=A0A7C8MML2_9PEZI|nr:hypothetical protein GQX73_g9362 [Xylaria multiplex]